MDNYSSNGDVPFSSGHKIVSIHGERDGRFASVSFLKFLDYHEFKWIP
jgi:hypothetical protein